MLVGKIDGVGAKHVSTEFVFLIGPVFPKCSWYVTGENYERHGNRSTYSWSGRRLPLQWSSVLLGYLRVWPAWLALAMPFLLMWGERVDFSRPEMLISAGLLVFWIGMLILPGRLSKEKKAQFRIMAQSTQLLLDPKRLPAIDREFILEDLAKSLELIDVKTDTPTVFLDRQGDLDPPDLGLLYTYARYRAVAEPAWRAAATTLWQRLRTQPA